jgi:hypothetical protein
MTPAELEELVDKSLKQLPLPRAPHTLVPRVLSAVQAWASRPWYARGWFTWPAGWQAALIAALILLAGASAMLLPGAWAVGGEWISALTGGATSDLAALARRIEVTANTAQVVWRVLFQPFVAYLFGLVALMCIACAAFGAALNRVVFERA